MKILILGAAGQIGKLVTDYLLEQTNHQLVLYARNAGVRLNVKEPARVNLVDGDFSDQDKLMAAMKTVDFVYLNDMNSRAGVRNIVTAMKETGVKRIAVASILGIYDEVPGAFGAWNRKMVGDSGIRKHKETAAMIETPELDYTILRLTWLYDKDANKNYMLTFKGDPFQGAQVTRQAVAQLVVDIINDASDKFVRRSLGVSEPNTNWDKPSFY
ncbi:NAD(P)H-binding protein [Fulvivirgaceae bacterium PWU5]|uniref:NAD(P)H-binding protein n=1 Tax=Dawidia cretensis TaxID=2782350 RepID=A0AAP2E4C9_9BACT|nr:NAD(P)H-binding protein [Dawidia cretensis]MBT1712360.1 NAD(P)H-binding protein [Dawidia cretensis]